MTLQPINRKFYNLLFILSWSALFVHLAYLSSRAYRIIMGAIFFIVILFVVTPSRDIDYQRIHESYLKNLSSYEGCSYLWGGENTFGIDCSGLPRKAYRRALFSYSLQSFNSEALRLCISQWWFDSSAKAMSENYRFYLNPIAIEGTVKGLDTSLLEKGDLAITADGVHVIVYLKENLWIQADPFKRKVIITDSKSGTNSWFDDEVKIYRWTNFLE